MKKGGSLGSGGNLYSGLTRKNPPPPRSPITAPSVNAESTRKGAAPTPKTLGPRTA